MTTFSRLWPERLGSGFALDLRSLALFRVLLALTLAFDALHRLINLGAFHTDAGLLPRDQWAQLSDPIWRWSLHLANGESWSQGLFLLAQALSALALALGWRTRVAGLLTWLLLVSVDNRNPLVLDAGDTLLAALLFWSLFLPMGARWSVDAALCDEAVVGPRHRSWASIVLVLQLLSSLFFSAVLQVQAGAGTQGRALLELLSSAQRSWGLGPALAAHPDLAGVVGLWWWWLLILGPVLLLLPLASGGNLAGLQNRLRNAVLLQLVLVQVLILLSLAAGHLPWAQTLGLSLLAGSGIWDRWTTRNASRQPPGELRVFYDRDCRFCEHTVRLLKTFLILPRALLLPAQDNRRADALMRANDSWVVLDYDDSAYLRGNALLLLLARSPLFGWLGKAALRLRLGTMADAAYRVVARHRAGLSGAFDTLPAPVPSRPASPAWQRLAAALALLALIWNLAGLSSGGARLQAALAPPLQVLRLDHRWSPLVTLPAGDHWWVAPGHLRNGGEIDVLRPHRLLGFSRPPHLASEPDGARWRLWQEKMLEDDAVVHRQAWARYLCHRWNGHLAASAPERLEDLRLIEMFAAPSGRIEQRVRLRQDCAGIP